MNTSPTKRMLKLSLYGKTWSWRLNVLLRNKCSDLNSVHTEQIQEVVIPWVINVPWSTIGQRPSPLGGEYCKVM